MIIDAHHHLWHYDPERYAWIGEGMEVLQRDFTAEDLAAEVDGLVDGVITVQARQDLEETRWLLTGALSTPLMLGVVGWVPLIDDHVEDHLARLADETALVGVRHVLQDEPDDHYMLRPDFNGGVAALEQFGLAYDILIYEHHLENAIRLVDRHPNQVFVLDHIAKPRIREGVREPWAANLARLAERENCYCKVSGLVTEADWSDWSLEDLHPYLDVVFDAFGPERLMFGSDWPVCLLAADYQTWHHLVEDYVAELSDDERRHFWGGTAVEAYRLAVE